ncbi:zinc finger protein 316-like [Alligator mississippiensis]|uniref:Zinc finger protein 316-like n=1 Tax=Alligator mississippiensis TaxID=8496 RepID=A0A151NJZ2_ALLMI|nr:zinc finger protein 316-like [Alligator mississippiensis]
MAGAGGAGSRSFSFSGLRETQGPKDELPHITKEEPPPNPDPGAGTLSRVDQQPPEEGSVNLELQRPSPGRRGQSGPLTPGLRQLQEGQGRLTKQGQSMELREVFEDVAVRVLFHSLKFKLWKLFRTGLFLPKTPNV